MFTVNNSLIVIIVTMDQEIQKYRYLSIGCTEIIVPNENVTFYRDDSIYVTLYKYKKALKRQIMTSEIC